jgi:hypothetical protein
VFAQSLLDTWNLVDLDDLVDGMNLTLEWGEANLELDGTVDGDWARWQTDALHDGKALPEDYPLWSSQPKKRRGIWEEVVSAHAKKNRQRHRYLEVNETRFWRWGQKDPRLRDREFCWRNWRTVGRKKINDGDPNGGSRWTPYKTVGLLAMLWNAKARCAWYDTITYVLKAAQSRDQHINADVLSMLDR